MGLAKNFEAKAVHRAGARATEHDVGTTRLALSLSDTNRHGHTVNVNQGLVTAHSAGLPASQNNAQHGWGSANLRCGHTRRVELHQELLAANVLVGFANGGRGPLKTQNRTQESVIRPMLPPDETAAPPAIGTQGVKTTVIPDAEGRVSLDIIATKRAQRGPRIEITGVAGDDCCYRGAALRHIVEGQRIGQRL